MILVDTGALLANYDRTDPEHARCSQALAENEPRILSPFVLAELDYLVSRDLGFEAEVGVLGDVARGVYDLADFSSDDISAAIQVTEQYPTFGLGLADASIIVLARRLRCFDVFTLDHRHFRAVTAETGRGLRLLPEDP